MSSEKPDQDTVLDVPDRLIDEAFDGLLATLQSHEPHSDEVASIVPALVACVASGTGKRRGYAAIALGLLAEADVRAEGEGVRGLIRNSVPTYLGAVHGEQTFSPVAEALIYLLSHFPEDRDRILDTAKYISVPPADLSRLGRMLQSLDMSNPKIGRVWPSPSVWQLTDQERKIDQQWIGRLTRQQVETIWKNDIESLK